MTTRNKNTNAPNPQGKGNPSDTGQPKASVKEVNKEQIKKEGEIQEEYQIEDNDQIPKEVMDQSNSNREPQKKDKE